MIFNIDKKIRDNIKENINDFILDEKYSVEGRLGYCCLTLKNGLKIKTKTCLNSCSGLTEGYMAQLKREAISELIDLEIYAYYSNIKTKEKK